jgi:hypothetical protein
MQTKLTLRIDEELIERAKSYAHRSGKSVSRLVSDYLVLLPEPELPVEVQWKCQPKRQTA